MIDITTEDFEQLADEAWRSLPGEHAPNIRNIAILVEEEPTPEQRTKLKLRSDQTLFGLYEGVPLPQRQGMTPLLPDKITLFKGPLTRSVADRAALLEQIRHTLWHEIGHYYGLDHGRIAELE